MSPKCLLSRFAAGGGALLDLEYLVDGKGRRLAAFGFWAGYLGAALAVLQHRGRLVAPLTPTSKEELDELLQPTAGDAEFTSSSVLKMSICFMRSSRKKEPTLDPLPMKVGAVVS